MSLCIITCSQCLCVSVHTCQPELYYLLPCDPCTSAKQGILTSSCLLGVQKLQLGEYFAAQSHLQFQERWRRQVGFLDSTPWPFFRWTGRLGSPQAKPIGILPVLDSSYNPTVSCVPAFPETLAHLSVPHTPCYLCSCKLCIPLL